MGTCDKIQGGVYPGVSWGNKIYTPDEQLAALLAAVDNIGGLSRQAKEQIKILLRQSKTNFGDVDLYRQIIDIIKKAMPDYASQQQRNRGITLFSTIFFGSPAAFKRLTGLSPVIIKEFVAFNGDDIEFSWDYYTARLQPGQALFIAFEPWDKSIGNKQQRIKDDTLFRLIAAKNESDLSALFPAAARDTAKMTALKARRQKIIAAITRFGQECQRHGRPFILSFGHEMNFPKQLKDLETRWYPWQGEPDVYIAAAQNFYNLITTTGATPTWSWDPINGFNSRPYYPAFQDPKYVDFILIHAYDSRTPLPFDAIYAEAYRNVHQFAPHKPIGIGEFSTATSDPQNESCFLQSAITAITANRLSFVLFIESKDDQGHFRPWAIDTPEAAAALRQSIQSQRNSFGQQITTGCRQPVGTDRPYEVTTSNNVFDLGIYLGDSFQFQLEKLYSAYREGKIFSAQLGTLFTTIFEHADYFNYISANHHSDTESIRHYPEKQYTPEDLKAFKIGKYNFADYLIHNLRNIIILLLLYSQVATEERDIKKMRQALTYIQRLINSCEEGRYAGRMNDNNNGIFTRGNEVLDPYWYGRLRFSEPTLLLQLPAEQFLDTLKARDLNDAEIKIKQMLAAAYYYLQNVSAANARQDPFSKIRTQLLIGDMYRIFYELRHEDKTWLDKAGTCYSTAFTYFQQPLGDYAEQKININYTYSLNEITEQIEDNPFIGEKKKAIKDIEWYLQTEAQARAAGILLLRLTAEAEAASRNGGYSNQSRAQKDIATLSANFATLQQIITDTENIKDLGLNSTPPITQNTFYKWQARLLQAEYLTVIANKALVYPALSVPPITLDGETFGTPQQMYQKARRICAEVEAAAAKEGKSLHYIGSRAVIKRVGLDMTLDETGQKYKNPRHVTATLADIKAAKEHLLPTDYEFIEATVLEAKLQNMLGKYDRAERLLADYANQLNENIDTRWDPYLKAMLYLEYAKAITWGTNEDTPNKVGPNGRYAVADRYFAMARKILEYHADQVMGSCPWIEVTPFVLSELYYERANAYVSLAWSYLDIEDKNNAAKYFELAHATFQQAQLKSQSAIDSAKTIAKKYSDTAVSMRTKIKLERLRQAQIEMTLARTAPYLDPTLIKVALLEKVQAAAPAIFTAFIRLVIVALNADSQSTLEEIIKNVNADNKVSLAAIDALITFIQSKKQTCFAYASILRGLYDFATQDTTVWLKTRDLKENEKNDFLTQTGLSKKDLTAMLCGATNIFSLLKDGLIDPPSVFQDYIIKAADLFAKTVYQQVLLASIILVDYQDEANFDAVYKPILEKLIGTIAPAADQTYESAAFSRMLELLDSAIEKNGVMIPDVYETTRSSIEALKGEVLFMRAFRNKDRALEARKKDDQENYCRYMELYMKDAQDALLYILASIDKARKAKNDRRLTKNNLLLVRLLSALTGDMEELNIANSNKSPLSFTTKKIVIQGLKALIAEAQLGMPKKAQRTVEDIVQDRTQIRTIVSSIQTIISALQNSTITQGNLENMEYSTLEALSSHLSRLNAINNKKPGLQAEVESASIEVNGHLMLIAKTRKDLDPDNTVSQTAYTNWLQLIQGNYRSLQAKHQEPEVTELAINQGNVNIGKLLQSLAAETSDTAATTFIQAILGIDPPQGTAVKDRMDYEKAVLEKIYADLLSPAEDILRSSARHDLWRTLGENRARLAFIERETYNADKGGFNAEEYLALISQALGSFLSTLSVTRNTYVKTEAEVWTAKIIMSLLADKKKSTVNQLLTNTLAALDAPAINLNGLKGDLSVLQFVDEKLLTPAGDVFKTRTLADLRRTRGENLVRQVFLLKTLEKTPQLNQSKLAAAQLLLEQAATAGSRATYIAANIWLSKIQKLLLSNAIRKLKDDNNYITGRDRSNLTAQLLAITDIITTYLDPLTPSLTGLENTFEYQEAQLARGELILQKAYLYKDLDNFANYTQAIREALSLLAEAKEKGNRQTRAEALLALVGLTLATAEDHVDELEAAWGMLDEIGKLVDFRGGQRTQLLKYYFESGVRLALSYRDRGQTAKWKKQVKSMEDSLAAANFMPAANNEDPDLHAVVYFWMGNLALAKSWGSRKELSDISTNYFDRAAQDFENLTYYNIYTNLYGSYVAGLRKREIKLAQARIWVARQKIGKAIDILDELIENERAHSIKTNDDRLFFAQLLIERADLYNWGFKQFEKAKADVVAAKECLENKIQPTTRQKQVLTWRAQLISAEIELSGSVLQGNGHYLAAARKYEAIATEIRAEAPTVTTLALLRKAELGASLAYGRTGFTQKAHVLAKSAAALIAKNPTLFPATKGEQQTRRETDRQVAQTGRFEVTMGGNYFTSQTNLDGKTEPSTKSSQGFFRVKADIWRPWILRFRGIAGGQIIDDRRYSNLNLGGEMDVGGFLQASAIFRPTNNPSVASSYYLNPRAQFNLGFDFNNISRSILPVSGNASWNVEPFEDKGLQLMSRFWQIGLAPTNWLPALVRSRSFLNNWQITLGLKQWRDFRAAYKNETTATVDFSVQIFNCLTASFGLDIPQMFDPYDDIDFRSGLAWRFLPEAELMFNWERSFQSIPVMDNETHGIGKLYPRGYQGDEFGLQLRIRF